MRKARSGAGVGSGNSRNRVVCAKAALTDVGPVEIAVPRDRDASFEPQIVKKRQRRLTGLTRWFCPCPCGD
ncbi:transposase [Streptomyces sp. NBC_01727]|nr:transposase [Streptomyces sp. NBC_01727]